MDARDREAHEFDWYVFVEQTMTLVVQDDEDEDGEFEVPAKYEVCGLCGGKGTHVNPSIDSDGITSDEWAEWDEDAREGYLSGRYDVPCARCGGNRVVPTINEDACSPELLERFKKAVEDHAASVSEDYNAARMGY